MTQLELSIIDSTFERYRDSEAVLQELLRQFEAESQIKVRITQHSWETAWSELVKVALYGHGPDISEVGSTWVGSFVGMNELYPFSREDIDSLGGKHAFVPGLWDSGSLMGDSQMWAIPWLGSTRVLFYRRDLLAAAGVDESTAFQTHEQLVDTISTLRMAGHSVPWLVPTQRTQNTLHFLSSWVWGADGRFLSLDGRRCLFNYPQAISGMARYFELGRFLPRSPTGVSDVAAEAMFFEGLATITVGGQWMLRVQRAYAVPEVLENTGVALVPGVPFVGGSHLVVWRHSPNKSAAMELVRFLVSKQVQVDYSHEIGQLPARLEALSDSVFYQDSVYRVVLDGLQSGRSLPSISLWGLVEDKLVDAMAQIWADLLGRPNQDIEALLLHRLEPLADRLNLTLGSS